jgi:uncharacterized membrane protein
MEFTFKIGEKIKEAWALYKENYKAILVLIIITVLIQFVGYDNKNILINLILAVISLVLSYTWIHLSLNLIDKKMFNIFSKEAIPSVLQVWNYFKTSFLYAFCILGGIILLIIPGFYFAGRLMFAVYLSVDKNQGAMVSLKESWDMTKGYAWQLLWKSIVIGLFMFLGIIAFLIGSIITYPIGIIVIVMMYREFTKFKLQVPVSSTPIEVVTDLPKETPVGTIA